MPGEINTWKDVEAKLRQQFGKRPDLQSILFLIGMQEIGAPVNSYSKEEKQDLMHVAVCKLLEPKGYFKFLGHDNDGWPHWEALSNIDVFGLKSQEELIKQAIVEYFDAIY